LELYKGNCWIYNKDIEQSDYLVIYKTEENGKDIEVMRIEKSELLKMIK